MDGEEEFIEKAVEGLVLGFFNQGEVCTCPSRALIHESIYEPFMARVMEKVAQIRRGDPLDTDTMIGAQASRQQFDKILSYIQIAREEGGQILTGGERAAIAPALDNGFYIQPTLIKGWRPLRDRSPHRDWRGDRRRAEYPPPPAAAGKPAGQRSGDL